MFDMIGNILKSLFAGPATRLYPHVKREPFPDARGNLAGIDADVCIYCGLCQRKCPALAITVDKATKTWSLDPYKCIVCNICVEGCPKKCMHMEAQYRAPGYAKQRVEQRKPADPAPAESPAAPAETVAARS